MNKKDTLLRSETPRKNPTETYAAFLRGVNNVGRNRISMAALKSIFEKEGMSHVRTVLASGNILFQSLEHDPAVLAGIIGKSIENRLGYQVELLLRTYSHLLEIAGLNPFEQVSLNPQTKRLVTFHSGKLPFTFQAPYRSPERDFEILQITEGEIYSIVRMIPGIRPYRIMSFLEKNCGSKITSRNWNTIQKVIRAGLG